MTAQGVQYIAWRVLAGALIVLGSAFLWSLVFVPMASGTPLQGLVQGMATILWWLGAVPGVVAIAGLGIAQLVHG